MKTYFRLKDFAPFLLAGLILFCLLGNQAHCQQVQPDCIVLFGLTTSGQSAPSNSLGAFDNRQVGCTTWNLSYSISGFSSITVALESAPNSSGLPGTWVTFAGATIIEGSNPNTITADGAFLWIVGYNPFVRVKLTAATGVGTVSGAAFGWRIPGASAAGGIPSNVNVAEWGGTATTLGQKVMASSVPITIASNQSAIPVSPSGTQTVQGVVASGSADSGNPVKVGGSNGTNDYNLKVDSIGNAYTFGACTNTAIVTLSGTGYNEVVAGTASQTIQVCKVFVTSATGGAPVVNNFSIARATVTTCASPTELFAANSVTGLDTDWGGGLRSGSSQSICISESVANSDKVTVLYSKAVF